jgi:hypothetical protein
MNNHLNKFSPFSPVTALLIALVLRMSSPLLASTASFLIPSDTALRIRLDDTLTSVDSKVGDPFSATVVDQGEYRNARVYGHVAQIDMSGRVKGNTSMVLRFDPLVLPDGRRAPIHAELLSSTTHLQAKRLMWKERSNQVVEAARVSSIQPSEPVLVLCWVESSAEVREPASAPLSAASGAWGPLHSMDARRSHSAAGRKC